MNWRLFPLLLLVLAAPALSDGTKACMDLQSGKAESARTGKPIFLVAIWPPGI